jgi:translation initiation factor 5
LKNQPKKGKKDKSGKKSRKDKEHDKASETNGNARTGSPGDSNSDNGEGENGDLAIDAGSDDELTRRINAEAKEIEQPTEVKEEEWAFDVSEEAVKARANQLPEDLKRALVVGDDDDDDGEGEGVGNSVYDQLGSWIISSAKEKSGGVGEVDDVDIYVKAKELGIETKHRTLAVLAQTIFDENIVRQISKRAGMLKKVTLLSSPLFRFNANNYDR